MLLLAEVVIYVEICNVHVHVEIHEVLPVRWRLLRRLLGELLLLMLRLWRLEELLGVTEGHWSIGPGVGWNIVEVVVVEALWLAVLLHEVVEIWHVEVPLGQESQFVAV